MDNNELLSPSPGCLHEAAESNPKHKSELLDEGLDESFPASDPTAISITRVVPVLPESAAENVKPAE
jgi:hypothetical protein